MKKLERAFFCLESTVRTRSDTSHIDNKVFLFTETTTSHKHFKIFCYWSYPFIGKNALL